MVVGGSGSRLGLGIGSFSVVGVCVCVCVWVCVCGRAPAHSTTPWLPSDHSARVKTVLLVHTYTHTHTLACARARMYARTGSRSWRSVNRKQQKPSLSSSPRTPKLWSISLEWSKRGGSRFEDKKKRQPRPRRRFCRNIVRPRVKGRRKRLTGKWVGWRVGGGRVRVTAWAWD